MLTTINNRGISAPNGEFFITETINNGSISTHVEIHFKNNKQWRHLCTKYEFNLTTVCNGTIHAAIVMQQFTVKIANNGDINATSIFTIKTKDKTIDIARRKKSY